MKVIELAQKQPTLDEIMGFAKDQLVVLRQPDGSLYAVSHVDEFAVEIEHLRNNPEFMELLKRFSQEPAVISLGDLRKELAV